VAGLTGETGELADGAVAGAGETQHLPDLPRRDLDPDAGQEADQNRAGEEVGEEAEPDQPRQQQQDAGDQGGQTSQSDVAGRAGCRAAGQPGGQDGRGGRVGADDKMP